MLRSDFRSAFAGQLASFRYFLVAGDDRAPQGECQTIHIEMGREYGRSINRGSFGAAAARKHYCEPGFRDLVFPLVVADNWSRTVRRRRTFCEILYPSLSVKLMR
jgi:hypothetical protein